MPLYETGERPAWSFRELNDLLFAGRPLDDVHVPEFQRPLVDSYEQVLNELAEIEAEEPDARPMPPMTREEAFRYLAALGRIAAERAWTRVEAIMHSQLIWCFEQGVMGAMLGRPHARYIVIDEASMPPELRGGGR